MTMMVAMTMTMRGYFYLIPYVSVRVYTFQINILVWKKKPRAHTHANTWYSVDSFTCTLSQPLAIRPTGGY